MEQAEKPVSIKFETAIKKEKQLVDKMYFLKNQDRLGYILQSRDKPKHRLMKFDEEKEIDRPLRYARNSSSPYIDEQGENVILDPIIFEDGRLMVQRTNQALQNFLDIHPGNMKNGGHVFYEHDAKKEATEDMDIMLFSAEAVIKARELSLNKLLAIGRVHLDEDVSNMDPDVLKRNIILFAKDNPQEFFEAIDDPDIDLSNMSKRALEEGYVTFRGGKDIHYNLKDNKKKILTVPYGMTAVDALASWLTSEVGVHFCDHLKKEFNQ